MLLKNKLINNIEKRNKNIKPHYNKIINHKNKMSTDYLETFKIIVVGNSFTGKTTFVKRWLGEPFIKKYKTTIVSEFGYKIFPNKTEINETSIKRPIKIQLWDLAGQDKDKYLTKLFCKNLQGVLILADSTNDTSLTECSQWRNLILDSISVCDNQNIPIYLIQNKYDLLTSEQQEQAYNKVKEFAEANSFNKFYLTSAKTYYNIKEAMISLIEDIDKSRKEVSISEMKSQSNIKLINKIKTKNESECQC